MQVPNVSSSPLVAIDCRTYNQEKYIGDTLEGFVMQKTNFPYVAIVHDDASTDDTAQIIKQYAEKYPDIIKPIIETENQYSKADGSLTRVLKEACRNTNAKYIALCEGDDYWTDPNKLQLQVDFLEYNPEYSMCFHKVDILNEGTGKIDSGCNQTKTKDYEHEEMQSRLNVATCSALMRKECYFEMPNDHDFVCTDNVLWATCRSMGKVRGFDKVMGVYRRVGTGWTAMTTNLDKDRYYQHHLAWIRHRKAMKRHFPNIDAKIFDDIIVNHAAIITILDARIYHHNLKSHFKEYYSEYGFKYLTAMVKVLASSSSKRLKSILQLT